LSDETKFYMVWASNSSRPVVRHATKASAQAEATRMATNHRGTRFYVLSAFERYEYLPEPVQVVTLPDPLPTSYT
jgi:hypothetical protein